MRKFKNSFKTFILLSMMLCFLIMPQQKSFASDQPQAWCKQYVDQAINQGYVPSSLQNNYQAPITRKEFAELFEQTVLKSQNRYYNKFYYSKDCPEELTRKFYLSHVEIDRPFKDTSSDSIKFAYILGMMEAYADDTFRPNSTITREDFTKMLIAPYRWSISNGSSERLNIEIADIDKISPDAVESISQAFYIGDFSNILSHGTYFYNCGHKMNFNPSALVTREEAISLMTSIDFKAGIITLRGNIHPTIYHFLSGFVVNDNMVKMKKSNYQSYEQSEKTYTYFNNFRKTHLIRDYDMERINSYFLFPNIYVNTDINNEELERVVTGEEITKTLPGFNIRYNQDGYSVIIEKRAGYSNVLSDKIDVRNITTGQIEYVNSKPIAPEPDNEKYVVKPALNDDERNTFIGTYENVYPQQWIIPLENGDYKESDLKPVGTKIGYVLATDKVVNLNGKQIPCYNIGGCDAIELDALKDFGYTYTFVDKSFDYNGHKVYTGTLKLIQPNINTFKHVSNSPKIIPSVPNGTRLYELVGDYFNIVLYEAGSEKTRGNLRSMYTTTGKRFILVDELWSDRVFYHGKMGIEGHHRSTVKGFKVEGSPFTAVHLKSTNLSLVKHVDEKTINITLLTFKEAETFDVYKYASQFPNLAPMLFDDYDYQAWLIAQEIVKKNIKSSMNDKQRLDAIDKALYKHGDLIRGTIHDGRSGPNFDTAYEALVEKLSNTLGWLQAYKMCLSLAGLDVSPTKEQDVTKDLGISYIPVKIKDKWEAFYVYPGYNYPDRK